MVLFEKSRDRELHVSGEDRFSFLFRRTFLVQKKRKKINLRFSTGNWSNRPLLKWESAELEGPVNLAQLLAEYHKTLCKTQ